MHISLYGEIYPVYEGCLIVFGNVLQSGTDTAKLSLAEQATCSLSMIINHFHKKLMLRYI